MAQAHLAPQIESPLPSADPALADRKRDATYWLLSLAAVALILAAVYAFATQAPGAATQAASVFIAAIGAIGVFALGYVAAIGGRAGLLVRTPDDSASVPELEDDLIVAPAVPAGRSMARAMTRESSPVPAVDARGPQPVDQAAKAAPDTVVPPRMPERVRPRSSANVRRRPTSSSQLPPARPAAPLPAGPRSLPARRAVARTLPPQRVVPPRPRPQMPGPHPVPLQAHGAQPANAAIQVHVAQMRVAPVAPGYVRQFPAPVAPPPVRTLARRLAPRIPAPAPALMHPRVPHGRA